MTMKLGLVGAGKMGGPMGRRLIAAGHSLIVCDINPEACARLAREGAEIRQTPSELADCEAIITSLPTPKEVELVASGPAGLLSSVNPGTLILETSTLGPAQSRHLEMEFGRRGATYLDAPVSNGVQGARDGTLVFMIGGDKAHFPKAKEILSPLASHVFYLGAIGSGNIAKILNQNIYLVYVAAFCEAMRLGRAAGLDVNTLVEVMRQSVAGDPLMTGWEKRIETADLVPGWSIRRVLKDLMLGVDVCSEQSFKSPVLEAAVRAFREAGEAGNLDNDLTSLYTAIQS